MIVGDGSHSLTCIPLPRFLCPGFGYNTADFVMSVCQKHPVAELEAQGLFPTPPSSAQSPVSLGQPFKKTRDNVWHSLQSFGWGPLRVRCCHVQAHAASVRRVAMPVGEEIDCPSRPAPVAQGAGGWASCSDAQEGKGQSKSNFGAFGAGLYRD